MTSIPRFIHSLAALGLALLAGAASAAQHKDPGNGCVVIAPRYLASSDYTFQYQGACKSGLAEGKGKAVWTLRDSPQNHVAWEGNFSAGVYLPPPTGIVSAREWSGSRGSSDIVIFNLGALPAQNGVPAARLQVEAAADLTHYPDPCNPRTLWVVNAPAAALAGDAVAQTLLAAAADKLKAHCGAAFSKTDLPGHDRSHVQVRAVATPDLQSDPWGNPGPVLAGAFIPLAAGGAMESYSNEAASQHRQQLQQAKDSDDRQANVQRLRTFFKTHQAKGWASLDDIAENPFRYSGRVVVTAAEVSVMASPTRAVLDSRPGEWRGSLAVLDGDEIGPWKPGPRLLAVRVLGRVKKDECDSFCGLPQLQLVGSEVCTESRCTDWLRLPTALQDGQKP
ncbi:MAG: hypothetical protein LBI48_08840 [Burkholderiaceae bacterium]|jgi:hypothetical protein|nr:hypothetical protein [Burkholderiaceae bacterium]